MQQSTKKTRVRFLTRLAVCIAMALAASAHAQIPLNVRLVDQASPCNPVCDGQEAWPRAYPSLQAALADAADPAQGVTEIWVAAATYKPGAAGAPGATFQIPLRLGFTLTLFGGFLGNAHPGGGETSVDEREWVANVTILSGDIDSNDLNSPAQDPSDIVGQNSYHVVTVINPPDQDPSLADTIAVDGFTITGGNADGDKEASVGGGAWLDDLRFLKQPGPIFRNCTFVGNRSDAGGGADLARRHATRLRLAEGPLHRFVAAQLGLLDLMTYLAVAEQPALREPILAMLAESARRRGRMTHVLEQAVELERTIGKLWRMRLAVHALGDGNE